MSVHVVLTGLGIVLEDEDNGVTAEPALGDRLDDLAWG